jgi:cell division protein FtsI/penicillin-binding protein 2
MENKSRVLVLLIVFVFLFFLVVLRLIDLQILNHSFYEKKSQEQRTRIIDLASQRGDIFDRNGNILATSIDTHSAYMHNKGWLARKLSLAAAEKIEKKYPKKVSLLKEKKRIYPKQNLAAQIIGFVGTDNQGLSGIELAFDEYLRGKKGRVITEGDPDGKELYGALRELESGVDGMNVTLTIDENIQYVAEREIEKQIKKSKALSGMCIVMDVKTGEILALASKPDFDPNLYKKSNKKLWHPRFVDPYEPGSTFKLITAAAALDKKAVTTDTKLKALDSIVVGGKVIQNAHEIKWPGKYISISEMLEESVNTGAVQVGLKLGPQKFYEGIISFGFGKRTGFGLWGESNGIVRHWKNWYKPDIGMITFGQSIAATPLQLLSAVSAFANHGKLVQPLLVKKIESLDGRFVKAFSQEGRGKAVSENTASQMKEFMRNIVVKGTGKPARMNNFSVGAKTGTAQKAVLGGRGYMKGHYIASFIGFAPLRDPQIIALVIVDDPKGTYWGSTVCGPVFKEVVEYSLRYLNVRPDML